MGRKKAFPPYEEAQMIVQKNGIKYSSKYKLLHNELGLPCAPDRYYSGKGWISWDTFLSREPLFPSYEEAKRIVQEKCFKSSIEYHSYNKELGLPSQPNVTYCGEGWTNWMDFLGKKRKYPTYEEAKKLIKEKGIKTCSEYKDASKGLGLPIHPDTVYLREGWVDWNSFLGNTPKEFPTYEEAQRIVQVNGVKCTKEYMIICNQLGLPSAPNKKYKDEWIDWPTFFGKDKKEQFTYEEAQRIVQEEKIKSSLEYSVSYKELGLPACPHRYYKDKGWIDWDTFLGKKRKTSLDERKYRILAKLSLSPILLQEDAPLQVLYILASELDKRLAKEMEELLGVTTFEERLNWVKEQLKQLKEGCPTIPKTIDITPSDELSAMGSLLEEFDLTDKVSFTLENYLHSAVNRELISEYDG